MLQRRCRSLMPTLLLCTLACYSPRRLASQSVVPDPNERPVFRANARTVVVDVVVVGKDGKSVQGLHKEDFLTAEDGHPQSITYFEEHSVPQSSPVNLPALPPNIFTNIPRVTPTDSVTVLLLDSLNTPLQAQSLVRAQMLKYLKGLPPGRRMAIFTLGTQLRYIQGFTDDSSVLSSVLSNQKSGAGPQQSPLLRPVEEVAVDQHAASIAAGLQQFQQEQTAFQTDQRVRITLEAFGELANYLAAVPGRKNIVWFSSGFPLVIFPGPDMNDSFASQRDYQDDARKTIDLLAAADVAIYPFAAEGLATDSAYDVSHQMMGVTNAQQAQLQQMKSLQTDSMQRNANHSAMDEIAKDTGGVAIYNTNGLNEALARVEDHGSHFYTLAYTPTNPANDGRFRKVQVKLSSASSGNGYKLAYRRGYYAASARVIKAMASKPNSDPLHPSMGPGIPDSTQIPLALRVQRGADQPASISTSLPGANGVNKPALAGDNIKLMGPVTRYTVDFVIAARGLKLDPAPDGGRLGGVEVALVVYDREGAALNWMVKQLSLNMDAARYAEVQANGVNFSLDIDVPKNGVSLRSGVYDLASHQAGTLELPLSSVVNTTQKASSKSP
jgi:VWFA-related protein